MKALEQIADYKEAAEILASEVQALGWHKSEALGGHIETDAEKWQHFAFRVCFAPPSRNPQFFDWKAGLGNCMKDHKGRALLNPGGKPRAKYPNLAEVLGRVCADYQSAASESFDGWAYAFGYDTDSRKAERVYAECLAQGDKLRALGLTSAQIQRFANLADML